MELSAALRQLQADRLANGRGKFAAEGLEVGRFGLRELTQVLADQPDETVRPAVLGIEASDRRQADGRHQRGEGEKTSVCVGNRPSNDHVGTQVEGGEHGSVPRCSVRDLDRHRRERGPRTPAATKSAASSRLRGVIS